MGGEFDALTLLQPKYLMRWNEIITEAFSAKLYHGTTQSFDTFDIDKMSPSGAYGAGFYFSNDLGLGRTYSDGGEPITATVVLKNPFIVDRDLDYTSDASREQRRVFRTKGSRERLIDAGHDGVLIKEGSYIEVVAYYPNQITIHKA